MRNAAQALRRTYKPTPTAAYGATRAHPLTLADPSSRGARSVAPSVLDPHAGIEKDGGGVLVTCHEDVGGGLVHGGCERVAGPAMRVEQQLRRRGLPLQQRLGVVIVRGDRGRSLGDGKLVHGAGGAAPGLIRIGRLG